MVKKCLEKIGKKCANINNEGQWLLRLPKDLRDTYKPGKMCPVHNNSRLEKNQSDSLANIRNTFWSQWSPYWNLKQRYLVEKSPQEMLKFGFLHELFSLPDNNRRRVKYLVIIKHPATLNIATPTDQGWLYHRDRKTSKDGQLEPMRLRNSNEQVLSSMQYFIQFMTRNDSKGTCELGWLPAFELFLLQQIEIENRLKNESFISGIRIGNGIHLIRILAVYNFFFFVFQFNLRD
jgi:hypothetical protein